MENLLLNDNPTKEPLTAPPPSGISYDAVALRAYFIALDRHRRGEPPDPFKDWTEAESQLRLANRQGNGSQ